MKTRIYATPAVKGLRWISLAQLYDKPYIIYNSVSESCNYNGSIILVQKEFSL